MAASGGLEALEEGIGWMNAFMGSVQGSMGETSTVAVMIGGLILVGMRIASYRIVGGVLIGMIATAVLMNVVGSETNPMFSVPAHWHLVIGGFAFGMMFMATDPVSASMTNTGRWCFGILVGVMTILIRVVNPAFPEGIMLAILFANLLRRLWITTWFRQTLNGGSLVAKGKETVPRTLLVALVLSIVFSVVVSTAAVVLRPAQIKNQNLDIKTNILSASGMLPNGAGAEEIESIFEQFEVRLVDLETGDYVEPSSWVYKIR